MRKFSLIILLLIFVLSCNEKEKKDIEICVESKQQLNSHCLLVKLIIKNNGNKNYLIPITPTFYLDNKMLQSIPSQIITSDSTNKLDSKMEFLLQEFTEKRLYKGISHEAYKMAIMKNYEEFSNSLFFFPKNSKREIFLAFNNYQYCDNKSYCNKIFNDENTKIRFDNYTNEDVKSIDSLINYNKLNYVIYKKNIYLKDSLYINR
ncbi:hypothetical protein GCM10022217_41590 [Chryseobacterium ginsenosidimutans]|uniref:hypothetical protein n=1 Tax=Chryseobacterium ginsenosidimutans TaxID=687846 RepID=UPI0031DAD119